MIQATDLRVGNFVEYNGTHYAVWSIATDYLELDSEPADKHYDNIKTLSANPIRLTPSILEACGFRKIAGEWYSEDEIFGVTHDYRHIWDGAFTGAPCDYLHQLQNLHWCLYGQELIYNPK